MVLAMMAARLWAQDDYVARARKLATEYIGIDSHIDWGASKFLTPQLQVGVAGYFYRQLTGDSGSGAVLGDFESQVAGIGPQIGYLFPAGDKQGYLNVRGYWEFAAEHRASGWNAFVTLAISPKAPTHR